MMLSRTGWGETSLAVAFQTVEGRRAPWGCAAGAPYRGTASPPPPVGVWVCGCVGVWVCGCVGVWVCGCLQLGGSTQHGSNCMAFGRHDTSSSAYLLRSGGE